MIKKSKLNLIVLIALIILVVAGFVYIYFNNSKLKESNLKQGQKSINSNLETKENLNDETTKDTKFVISQNENFIVYGNNNEIGLILAKKDGTILKIFDSLTTKGFFWEPIMWSGSDFWVSSNGNVSVAEYVFKINTLDLEVTKFDVSGLLIPAFSNYYMLNPVKEKIVFDDYPTCDYGGCEKEMVDYVTKDKTEIHLMVYDFKTGIKIIIEKSIAKWFDPKWLDENTIEYNNPNGTGRITKQIP